MATFNNGESGLSVRTKLNEIINKVEGVTSIDNNIDITGTLTSDGLTVDGTGSFTDNVSGGVASLLTLHNDNTVSGTTAELKMAGGNGLSTRYAYIRAFNGGSSGGNAHALFFGTNAAAAAPLDRMSISSGGDISFYEDTGTTAKFFWDAAAESLGLGQIQTAHRLNLGDNSGDESLIFTVPANGLAKFTTNRDSASFTWNQPSGELMRIDSSGNVGIGTTSPSTSLTIVKTGAAIQNTLELRNNQTLAAGVGSSISFADSTGSRSSYIGGAFEGSTNDDGYLTFVTRSSDLFAEVMRITSDGSVGIGTSSPTAQLHLSSANSSTVIRIADSSSYGEIANSNGSLYLTADRGNVGSKFMSFRVGGTSEAMRIDSSGNLLIGGTGTPTSSAKNLVLYNGTAPTGSATDGVILYAEDVSSSSELKVRDEAGNVTTLSPHNFDLIPEGPSEDMAWSYYSERDGKRINVDMLKAIRLLEQISGEKLVHMV